MSRLQNLGAILVKELKTRCDSALVIVEYLNELNDSCSWFDHHNRGIFGQHWLSLALHQKLETSMLSSLHCDSLNE